MAERAALLGAVRASVATSATALVADLNLARADDEVDAPVALRPDEAGADETRQPVRRRTAGRGAAIGSAVHRTLELVALSGASDDEVQRLAEAACTEQQIPDLVSDVAARVRNALAVDLVRQTGSRRRWREVYVVCRDGQRYVEGYIDLLAEDDVGNLVVVDYKTDRAATDPEALAKADHYRPQLRAYAEAVRRGSGITPQSGVLLFLIEEQRADDSSYAGQVPSVHYADRARGQERRSRLKDVHDVQRRLRSQVTMRDIADEFEQPYPMVYQYVRANSLDLQPWGQRDHVLPPATADHLRAHYAYQAALHRRAVPPSVAVSMLNASPAVVNRLIQDGVLVQDEPAHDRRRMVTRESVTQVQEDPPTVTAAGAVDPRGHEQIS